MTSMKKGAVNFSFKDVRTLLALVKKYASSIQRKKTSVNSNKLRADAFEKLAFFV